jgi:hypothetical protein
MSAEPGGKVMNPLDRDLVGILLAVVTILPPDPKVVAYVRGPFLVELGNVNPHY